MAERDDEELGRSVTLEEAQSLLRSRRQAEEALHKQAEWLRITLASIGDAVISTDAEGRVMFLNGVAEELTGWPQAEAAGRPLVEIFRIINEHTRQPVDNPALRALREGRVVALANHTLLIARDGTERPIEDSAAAIREGAEPVLGAVLVFRDVTERKRDEVARARLASIVETSEDAIVSKSLDGIILSWNAGAERLFGYSASEAIGQSITLIIPLERREEERLILERLRRGERVKHFETVRVAKDGRCLDISLTISPLRDRYGQIIGAAKVARDITDRKRAEAALRESEGRHRFLAALAAATQPLTDPDAVMHVAARLLAEHLGVDRCAYAEIEDEKIFVITGDHPIGVPSIVGRWPVASFGSECTRLMLENEPYIVEDVDADPRIGAAELPAYRATTIAAVICVPLHKGGKFAAAMAVHSKVARKWTPAEVQLVRTVVGQCWESLERLRMTRSLLASEARYRQAATEAGRAAEANAKFRAFFEQGTNFAGVLALDGTVVEANRLCLDGCGFTRQDVIGRPFWACGWWNRSAEIMERVRVACRQAAAGQLFRTETNYFVSSGAERIVDLVLAPVTDEAGRVLFVAATGSDITDRRQLEDSLRAADRKKDDFIALLAHELRNPLAPIRNGLQVLRLAAGNLEAGERVQAMMDRQLSHMVRLIDDLLDVSRINRNKMELRRSRVALADVVSSAVETARPLIDEKGHELALALPPGPIYLDADLTRLAQVFSNLLTNSAKYTPRGGRIWLSVEPRGAEVAVAVRDTGVGIPVESLASIFDMFAQLDRPLERATDGLGIGLALVKGLVEMHGGTVQAHSGGPGQGSTFTVNLPILPALAEPTDPAAASRGPAATGPRRRILVVDDNRDGAETLAMMLRLLNNEVQTAHDGIEAVEAADAFRPHVILMDLGMPRLNGYDATRRIREHPWGRSMTIVALTGWGQEGDRARSHAAGCNAHLVKPVNMAELERLLAGVSPAAES
ncbi:MAG TPA: PAS domain S-box protein [Pseudomonadota bacterium]|nr:PAS domain S-box protein [Pseudomonadota bacterium]